MVGSAASGAKPVVGHRLAAREQSTDCIKQQVHAHSGAAWADWTRCALRGSPCGPGIWFMHEKWGPISRNKPVPEDGRTLTDHPARDELAIACRIQLRGRHGSGIGTGSVLSSLWPGNEKVAVKATHTYNTALRAGNETKGCSSWGTIDQSNRR